MTCECGGVAIEVTAHGDRERRFMCGGHWSEPDADGFAWLVDGDCGREWGEPFDELDVGDVPRVAP